MNNLDKLVDLFLKQGCSAEQADLLAKYFSVYPEALDVYLSERDWEKGDDGAIPANIDAEVWTSVQAYIQPKQRTAYYIAYRAMLVAAILLLLPMLWWTVTQSFSHTRSITGNTITVQNNGEQILRCVLKDGSVITLNPGAVVRYDTLMDAKERRIQLLAGKSLFEVVANPERPFVVQTGAISTTALGTRFSVTQADTVVVSLFSGKVVVRAQKDEQIKYEWYMQPGNTCNVHHQTLNGALKTNRTFKADDVVPSKQETPVARVWHFNKISLHAVLDTLQYFHHLNISIDSAATRDLKFTGALSAADAPEQNLRMVCLASGLQLEQRGHKKFIIKTNNENKIE